MKKIEFGQLYQMPYSVTLRRESGSNPDLTINSVFGKINVPQLEVVGAIKDGSPFIALEEKTYNDLHKMLKVLTQEGEVGYILYNKNHIKKVT